jgi:hypothetical protein
MTLDAYEYGDPMTVAIRRQEAANRKLRECGNCKHHLSAVFNGETLHRCEIRRYGFGKRCDSYEVITITKKGKHGN